MPTYRFYWGKEDEQQITLLIHKNWEEVSNLIAPFLKELEEGANFTDEWLRHLYKQGIEYTNITADYRFDLWQNVSTKGMRSRRGSRINE